MKILPLCVTKGCLGFATPDGPGLCDLCQVARPLRACPVCTGRVATHLVESKSTRIGSGDPSEIKGILNGSIRTGWVVLHSGPPCAGQAELVPVFGTEEDLRAWWRALGIEPVGIIR